MSRDMTKAALGRRLRRAISAQAYSIAEFCEAHNISRATFYSLLESGRGPVVMKVGRRRLISNESAGRWRARMEKAA